MDPGRNLLKMKVLYGAICYYELMDAYKYLSVVLVSILSLSVVAFAGDTIIESDDISVENWVDPEFSEPTYEDPQPKELEVRASKAIRDWQYLKVQVAIPYTQAVSRFWFEQKVLREMARERQRSAASTSE